MGGRRKSAADLLSVFIRIKFLKTNFINL